MLDSEKVLAGPLFLPICCETRMVHSWAGLAAAGKCPPIS